MQVVQRIPLQGSLCPPGLCPSCRTPSSPQTEHSTIHMGPAGPSKVHSAFQGPPFQGPCLVLWTGPSALQDLPPSFYLSSFQGPQPSRAPFFLWAPPPLSRLRLLPSGDTPLHCRVLFSRPPSKDTHRPRRSCGCWMQGTRSRLDGEGPSRCGGLEDPAGVSKPTWPWGSSWGSGPDPLHLEA